MFCGLANSVDTGGITEHFGTQVTKFVQKVFLTNQG